MNIHTIDTAMAEAERFIERAKALMGTMSKSPSVAGQNYTSMHPKESGAVKRASMDLTRSLADLRRGG